MNDNFAPPSGEPVRQPEPFPQNAPNDSQNNIDTAGAAPIEQSPPPPSGAPVSADYLPGAPVGEPVSLDTPPPPTGAPAVVPEDPVTAQPLEPEPVPVYDTPVATQPVEPEPFSTYETPVAEPASAYDTSSVTPEPAFTAPEQTVAIEEEVVAVEADNEAYLFSATSETVESVQAQAADVESVPIFDAPIPSEPIPGTEVEASDAAPFAPAPASEAEPFAPTQTSTFEPAPAPAPAPAQTSDAAPFAPAPAPASTPAADAYSTAPAQTPTPMATPTPVAAAQKPKKSKKPLIIVLAAVAVAIIAIVAFFGIQEMNRSNTYDTAIMNFDNGEYALAEEAFLGLGDYKDSAERATVAGIYSTYEQAKQLYEEGAFADAKSMFSMVAETDISDVLEWLNKCDYALADELYAEGNLEAARDSFAALANFEDASERVQKIKYELADKKQVEGDIEGAYNAFSALGTYADSADRAAALLQPWPGSGVLWQAEGSHYDLAAIEIDYRFSEGGSFYKIYSGETLMAMLFCNANSTVRVYLQPGNYTIKEGTGDTWFGTDLAFGKKGSYSTMTYDDAGTDWFALSDGSLVTITINADTDGNVGERGEDLSSF